MSLRDRVRRAVADLNQPSTVGVGWYPYPTHADPDQQAYWDGRTWSAYRSVPRPEGSVSLAPTVLPAEVHGTGAPRPQYVSGVSTGEKIAYVALALPTAGLSLPVLAVRAWLGRKRIR